MKTIEASQKTNTPRKKTATNQHWNERTQKKPANRPRARLSVAKPGRELDGFDGMDDLTLLRAAISGHNAAWNTFFHRFRGLILSCAMKVAARSGFHLDSDDLMDVLGEVYLNMVANDFRRLRLYRVDGGCSVATWIGVIATSTAKDHLRKSRRHRLDTAAEGELDRVAAPNSDPEDWMLDRQRRGFVDQALEKLSRRDRDFVELYFAEARSPDDIAEIMGVSVSTVYSKKAKIKARLTRLVQAEM